MAARVLNPASVGIIVATAGNNGKRKLCRIERLLEADLMSIQNVR